MGQAAIDAAVIMSEAAAGKAEMNAAAVGSATAAIVNTSSNKNVNNGTSSS